MLRSSAVLRKTAVDASMLVKAVKRRAPSTSAAAAATTEYEKTRAANQKAAAKQKREQAKLRETMLLAARREKEAERRARAKERAAATAERKKAKTAETRERNRILRAQSQTILTEGAVVRNMLAPKRSPSWYALFLKSIQDSRPADVSPIAYAAKLRKSLTPEQIEVFKAEAASLKSEKEKNLSRVPKRPLSSYMRYAAAERPNVQYPADVTGRDRVTYAAKVLGAQWRALPDAKKEAYVTPKAELDAYRAAMDALKGQLTVEAAIKKRA